MNKSVLVIVTLAATVLAAQPPAALTPEQTLDRRGIADLELSPDRSRVVFTVTEPIKGSVRQRNIWLLDLASARVRQLTFAAASDGSPRWAPDGGSLAFLSDRDGVAQLYVLSMGGGEARKLTDRKEAISALRWSPDGRHIALLMAEAKSDLQQQREKDKDDAHRAEKDDRLSRVWEVEPATGAIRQVTTRPFRIEQIDYLPTGDRLIVVASSSPLDDQFNESIYSVDVKSGSFTMIAAPRGPIGAFALSPDGATIAYGCARVDGPAAHDLCLQPAAGGAARNLTATAIDRPVNQGRWVAPHTIAMGVARGFQATVELMETTGTSGPQPIAGLVGNVAAFTRTADGTLVYVSESAARAPELWIKTPAAPARAVTTFNERWATRPVVTPEFVKYKSADGTEIEAALLQPAAATPKPLPAVILVHGGPTGRWADTFEPWGQLLAAHGYAVLYPNVRGSIGYGQHFVEMNRADWGGGDFKDVIAGADWLVARGIADPNRLGIGGWSYGGYMAAWAVTQTQRFKAAVSGAPVIDMASEFGTENGSAYDEWFYGTPYEKLDRFIRSSPMTFVRQVKTPTLLLQGENDTTDPIGQSQQFYRGLKRYGVPSELVLYPREPHGLREEKHLIDRLTRIVAWYDMYLKPANPPATPPR